MRPEMGRIRIDMKFPVWILGVFLLHSIASAAPAFPAPADLPAKSDFPDVLLAMDGEPIRNARKWFEKRRPELKTLFQHYQYGYIAPRVPIQSKVEHTDTNLFGGRATLKLISISFPSPTTSKINLMLVTPNGRTRPAPVFLGLNFCGNHALLTNTSIPLTTNRLNSKYPGVTNHHATEAARGTQVDVWALGQSIERGYAVATFHYGDLQEDSAEAKGSIRDALHGAKDPDHDWGAIAAWAWGLHRAVDYLMTDATIDNSKIAVVGHSRLGKTALLATAFDDRIALAIPNQAGCGGTAPSRSTVGESVKQINDRFPHWFCGAFKKFNDQPERLPVDQHCLIAICAPRPVLLSNATEDTWANPAGQFEMLKLADRAYRMVGKDGLNATNMPAEGNLIDSKLGYYIRAGKHSMTKGDWKVFLDYADKHLGQ